MEANVQSFFISRNRTSPSKLSERSNGNFTINQVSLGINHRKEIELKNEQASKQTNGQTKEMRRR